mgnify:CR=1 FL=1
MSLTPSIHRRDGTAILGDEFGRGTHRRMPGRRCPGQLSCTAHKGSTYGYTIEALPGGGWGTREVTVRDLTTGKVRVVKWKKAVREEEILERLGVK